MIPLLSLLLAIIVTLISLDGRQDDDRTSKVCLQILRSHDEAGMIAEPHKMLDIELE